MVIHSLTLHRSSKHEKQGMEHPDLSAAHRRAQPRALPESTAQQDQDSALLPLTQILGALLMQLSL